jgi:hypothetical protein
VVDGLDEMVIKADLGHRRLGTGDGAAVQGVKPV